MLKNGEYIVFKRVEGDLIELSVPIPTLSSAESFAKDRYGEIVIMKVLSSTYKDPNK